MVFSTSAAANQRVSAGFSKLLTIDRRTFKRLVGSDKVATSSTMRETLVGSKSPRCVHPAAPLAPHSTGPELAVLAPRRSAARIRDIDSGIWDDSEEEDVSSQPATICSSAAVSALLCANLCVCLKRGLWCVCVARCWPRGYALYTVLLTRCLSLLPVPVPLSQPARNKARIPRRRNGTEKRSSRSTHPSGTTAKRRSTPLAWTSTRSTLC